MILDIGAHSRSVPVFAIPAQGARLLKSLNRFTAYGSYPIELKLGRMILDINPHDRSVPDFSVSFRGVLWGRSSCNIEIDS